MVVVAPGGCAALFDGGPTGSGAKIKSYLKSIGVTRLDLAFTSHFHADHLGGIDEVDVGTDAVPITAVYDRGGTYSSTAFTSYSSHFSGRRFAATLGQTFSLCGQVTLTVVAVNGNGSGSTDENAKSLVLKVSWGAFDALIGGDLTGGSPDIESLITPVGEVELYKVHHHGSKFSSNAALLAQLKPTVSFISVGVSNSYGHPTPECLGRLAAVGSQVWQTEDPATNTIRGHVELSSPDGASFTVRQGAASVTYPSKGAPPSDTQPPSAPGALAAAASSTTEVDLGWVAATDNVGVTGYRVFRSADGLAFSLAGTSSSTAFADVGLTPGSTWWYQVTALDAAGNESAPGPAATATTPTPDSTPPSAPGALTASAPSSSEIDLAWEASTDDVGVTGYRVYRSADAVTFSVAGTASGTGFADLGLAGGTTWFYRVTAVDAAGNESAPSAVASATTATPDVTPPSAPPTLTATASSFTQIDLAWGAASDAGGVTGYRVYRSADGAAFALAGTSTGTAYSDPGRTAGTTTWYRVTALDAAGNESAPSPTAAATTPAATVTVTAPNGGESWAGGTVHDVTWTSSGVASVRIEYSSNGGSSYVLVASGVAASAGRYGWTVPTSATSQGRIRVAAEAGTAADVSDANFTLTAAGPGKIILNELLANEPGATTSSEFIELVNVGGQAVSLAGWQLRIAGNTQHTFAAGTTLQPGRAIVVFAGASGIPAGLTNAVAASTGSLGLANGGATVQLRDGNRKTVDAFTYSAALAAVDGVSMNRSPDATAGAAFVLHTSLAAASSSPGIRPAGAAY